MRRALTASVALLLLLAGLTAVVRHREGPSSHPAGPTAASGDAAVAAARPPSAPPPPPAPPPNLKPLPPADPVPLPLDGCPPPPPTPDSDAGEPPWRPDVLVAEEELPEPLAPAASVPGPDLGLLGGKGMWVWKYRQSEAGDPDAIVAKAVAAGLRQLWVRVGDSRDGFYAADVLAQLVPRAHAAGLSVIGWGFPFLWDPVDDARWTAEAIAWRGPGDAALDGFSPDIEMGSEGVELSARRAQVYLGLARQASALRGRSGPADTRRPLVATVYPPRDGVWEEYPYEAIAPYVDAFAPMVYWGCTEPGTAAAQALERLAPLRPVHLIGQGYNMADEGGRTEAPDAAETVRFLDVARRGGAVGASFWVWQSMGADQWDALTAFPWQ